METLEGLNEKGQKWYKIIKSQGESGETIKGYCIKNRLGMKNLYRWKKILADKGIIKRTNKSKARSKFQAISILKAGKESAEETIKIHFPNGMMVEMQGEVSTDKITSIISKWI